jgi:hypothetical protein
MEQVEFVGKCFEFILPAGYPREPLQSSNASCVSVTIYN